LVSEAAAKTVSLAGLALVLELELEPALEDDPQPVIAATAPNARAAAVRISATRLMGVPPWWGNGGVKANPSPDQGERKGGGRTNRPGGRAV
jgi:hypothetical protein